MKTTTLLMLAVALGLVSPGIVEAQPAAGKVYRLGVLSPGSVPAPSVPTIPNLLPAMLAQVGYVEGKNLVVERRFAEDSTDRLPALARELVQLRPDVIVAVSGQATEAARNATSTIPIVMVISTDPVARGLVASFARPGGNVTGVSTVAETSLAGKRLELLKEAVPKASRVAVMASGSPLSSVQMKEAQAAAPALKLKIVPVGVHDANYDRAFAKIVEERAEAIFVITGPTLVGHRSQIMERAMKHRLPVVSSSPELTEAGALLSYGGGTAETSRRATVYVDKILKGAKPADLPIEQPTKFELTINLKTAKALGLTLPQSLLERADKVIRP